MRKILDIYRLIQYCIFGRKRFGVMQPGVAVQVEPFRYEENKGDVVHPCVRYIPGGFEGHCWWMVYTPYYKANASLENPVLCYSDSNDPNKPPIEWKHYCLVNEKPKDGYNSDPTLLYHEGQLYVFWRENYENNGGKYPFVRATFIAKVSKGEVFRISEPLLITTSEEEDPETCPTFMPTSDGRLMAYGMHLRFHSERIKKMRPKMKKFVNIVLLFTDLLGLYSQQKHYGLAVWQQNKDFRSPYHHKGTIRIAKCNKLYRPWHMDFFDNEGIRYAIIQTNQSNADICLAYSIDNEHFTFYKKPLLTNKSIEKVGMYKPCAGVTDDGLFYLYYTAQDKNNRSLNKLYLSTIFFKDLLEKIQ